MQGFLGSCLREKQEFDSNCQPCVQQYHHNYENSADLLVCSTDDRPKVSHEEESRQSKTCPNEDPVKQIKSAPADEGNRDPYKIRISIESPTL